MTITAKSALTGIPVSLREELLEAYNSVLRNYRERRWEPSELNGGKLCEVVYTILKGHIDGSFPAKAVKPSNMLDACKALEKAPASFPRSIRIQIPRMLIALYEIRNNRGVGHVGGDVNPNLMDATAVLAMSKWLLAELVRVFHNVSTDEAGRVIETLVQRTMPIVWSIGGVNRVLEHRMAAREKVLVLLYHASQPLRDGELQNWIEYENSSQFRRILQEFHRTKLVEYDRTTAQVVLSPLGIEHVEAKILPKLK